METQPRQRVGKGCMVLLHDMKSSSGKTGSEPSAKQVSTQALSSSCWSVVSTKQSRFKNNASALQMKLPPMSFLSNLLCLQVRPTFFFPLPWAPRTGLVPGSWSHPHSAPAPAELPRQLLPPAPRAEGRRPFPSQHVSDSRAHPNTNGVMKTNCCGAS